MTRRIENRAVEVKVCDFCGVEVDHLERCVLCGREACFARGLKEHMAYHIEVYRYAEDDRVGGYVCRECTFGWSLKGLLEFIQKAK